MAGSSTTKKNLVSTYLKGIDSQLNKKVGGVTSSSILASSQSGHHTKMIGTSRNNQALIAPAGTKNKIGGAQIHTALVNLQNPGIDDNHNLGGS